MGVTYVLNCNSHIFVCEGDIALSQTETTDCSMMGPSCFTTMCSVHRLSLFLHLTTILSLNMVRRLLPNYPLVKFLSTGFIVVVKHQTVTDQNYTMNAH